MNHVSPKDELMTSTRQLTGTTIDSPVSNDKTRALSMTRSDNWHALVRLDIDNGNEQPRDAIGAHGFAP